MSQPPGGSSGRPGEGPPRAASAGANDDHLGMVLASEVESGGVCPEPPGSTVTWPATAGLGGPSTATATPNGPRVLPDFGKYELIGEIGRGGMGVVYKARQKDLDRLVAIKMILSSHLASVEQVERFYAEARAAARLRWPHIVAIHDVGQIHGQHYFAMDYVAGPSLAQVLQSGPLDPDDAARHVLAVGRAVSHLHAQGIVHRDLKPSNIILDEHGRPCLTDFGLAKMLGSDGRMTRSGAIVGTPGYMAPEQAAGRASEVGPLSDVYSLGAILYELVTGRPPFSGDTPLDTLVQVLEAEPPRPGRLRPGLPRALESICLRCLEKSPLDRYPSASALVDDLDHYLRGEPVEASRTTPWQHVRRWARREPALATRLSTMAACGAILQGFNALIQPVAPLANRRGIAVVVAWAAASVAFQNLLRKDRWAGPVRYAWAAADVAAYTVLVLMNEGLTTSLVAGYFLLVAASGLWFRERLVWFTTVTAVSAYGALVLNAGLVQSSLESPYRHFLFAAFLAVSGLVVGYQVKRVRALSLYYENRPLP